MTMKSQSSTEGRPGIDDDELLACLLILTRSHGEAASADAVLAGLPLEQGRLTPALFERAAHRAGLASRMVRQPLHALKADLFPVVLLLQGNRACLLVDRSADGLSVQLVHPELGEAPVSLPVEHVESSYSGRAIYARPRLRFDARTPEVSAGRHGHWFWSVIADNRALYRDVLLAAFLTNLFALAMPMFTMNVYDRVVPNQAFETLAALSVGLLLVLLGDLVLRMLRTRFVDLASSRADVRLSARIMERVLGMRMEQRPASAGSFASNLRSFESVPDFIGSAAVIVLSQHDKARDAALNVMKFFAHESCGQCTPCRVGTDKAAWLMEREVWDRETLQDLAQVMGDASICGLGQAAPNPIRCVLDYFPHEVEAQS